MTMLPPQNGFKHIVAIEVAKDELVIHILPGDRRMRIANTAKAIQRLLRAEVALNEKHRIGPLLVICEATGGYERHVLEATVAFGLACHRAHGTRVRHFAKSLGKAKSDPIDAHVLTRYGANGQDLHLYAPPSPEVAQLKELKARRDQLQGALMAENNRLGRAVHAIVRRSLQHSIAALGKALAVMEDEIALLMKANDTLAEKARLLRSLKGIGPITAITLIAGLPELGSLSKGQVARLTGLAPINQDSGKKRGGRHIEAGRAGIRRCLYMAAVVAMRRNLLIKDFAARLKARGKPPLVVIAAVMRKMIVILNAVLKTGKPWNGAQTA
jgi:transposase